MSRAGLGHAGRLDLLLEFLEIGTFLAFAELLLDRLDLLVQVVLALALLHLPLHAAADALFHLQDVDLGLELREQMLEALVEALHLEDLLLLLDLERQVRGDRVGQAPGLVDAGDRGEDFGRDLLVELHVLVELADDGTAQRLDLAVGVHVGIDRDHVRREVARAIFDALDARALGALDQHLHGAVGQLQHLQDVGDAADLVDVLGGRLVLGGVLLRHQHDALARFHRGLEGLDRLRAADEQWNDHVREHDHVAQRQQRQRDAFGRQDLGRHRDVPLNGRFSAGYGCGPGQCKPGESSRWINLARDANGRGPARRTTEGPSGQRGPLATFGWSAYISRGLPPPIVFSSTMTLATFFVLGRSYMTSSSTLSTIERRPRAPVLRLIALRAIDLSASGRISSSTPSIWNSRWNCLIECILRLDQDLDQGVLAQFVERGDDRQTADQFRDQAELDQVLGFGIAQHIADRPLARARHLGAEADAALLRAVADDLLESVEGAAADEQDIGRVDLHEILVRMLAPALRRHRGDRALDQLQQRLLHAFARHITRDGRVVALARDLVDLVDVDDAALRLLDVVIAVLQQLLDDVLDVLADVPGLGQRGGVGDHERHVQQARQRLREQRLAGSGRADEQDVALGELDVVLACRDA